MDGIKFNVLVLDDEIEITEIIHAVLTRAGILCEIYNDPRLALVAITQKKFAAVLSDISMPGMNGIELLRQVRASGNEVPFVFLTAYTDTDLLITALKLGAMDYIPKPFQNNEVVEVISRAMEIGKRSQDLKADTTPEQRERDLKFMQKLRLGKK